jgi:hypothetical protein
MQPRLIGTQRAHRNGVGTHHTGLGFQLRLAQRGLDPLGGGVDAALRPGAARRRSC